jgi:uncharacterized protein (DUF3084 family)
MRGSDRGARMAAMDRLESRCPNTRRHEARVTGAGFAVDGHRILRKHCGRVKQRAAKRTSCTADPVQTAA